MRFSAYTLCCLLFGGLISGCGSGGGGGGTDGSSARSANLKMNNTSANFSASIGQYSANTQTITGSITNAQEQTYYLFVDLRNTDLIANAETYFSGNQGSVELYPASASNLEPGIHTGMVGISVCLDERCSKHIEGSPQSVTVRYEVLYDPNLADSDGDGIVDKMDPFPKVANQMPVLYAEPLFFADAGKAFSLNANSFIKDPDADALSYRWSQFSGRSVLANEYSGDTLNVVMPSDVNTAEPLHFMVTATDAYGAEAAINVAVTLLPALSYSFNNTRLGGYVPGQNLEFSLQLTGHEASSWKLSAPLGVSLSSTQGSGSQLITGTLAAGELALGNNRINLTLTDVRQAVDHPLALDVITQHDRPVVLKNGLALSKVGDNATLSTHFVVLSERGDSAMTWTASSDQPWLSLSQSEGRAGDVVTVTADPSALVDNQQYQARITLQGAGDSAPEYVTLNLYLRAQAAETQTTITASAVMRDLATDPIRPYLYTVAGTGKLYVYDFYRAEQIAAPTIGGNLNSVAVSHDGMQIFVFDSLEKRIFVLNANSFAIEKQFSLAALPGVTGKGLTYLRPKGVGALLVGGQSLIHAHSGVILHSDTLNTAATYVAEGEDRALQGFTSASNYYDIYSLSFMTNAILGEVKVNATLALNTGGGYGFPIDFASNRDMSKVWISTGAQVEIYNFSSSQGLVRLGNTDGSLGWQNALEPSPDYNSYYLGQDSSNNATVCAYSGDLNLELGCVNPPGLDAAIRMLKLSSDGQRGVIISDDNYGATTQPITFFNALH